MKYQITNSKRVMIIASIVVALVAIILLIFFNIKSIKKETVAQPINEEERIAEDPVNEIIDIEELEQQENEEEQNVVENTTNNETTNNTSTTNNQATYYIKVNYGAQVVTIYKKDEQGNYTVPVKAMVCSTGVATPTSGVYSIPARWEWLHLQGDVYGHYSTQIKGNILFHSVPYLTKGDPSSLEYWEYDKLGTYASAGCIRLTVKDAKWIYDNCAKGTQVEFYSSSNPGPLGKPSAKKISSYPDYLRNWDPTDVNPNNPWLTYKEEVQNASKNETVNNTTQSTTTNTTITNTTQNVIVNTIENTTTNEVTNTVKNEKTNTIDNTTKNETTNKTTNKTTNEQTKENETTNTNKQNEVKNKNEQAEKTNENLNEVA